MKPMIPTLLSALAFAGAAHAQVERYALDPAHTDLVWFASHMGFSESSGTFENVQGELVLDRDAHANSRVDVTVAIDQLNTGQPDFTEHLLTADFFDAEQYPTARFRSNRVELTGETTAWVHGDLTLRGVTKPAVLDVRLNKIGQNPMDNKQVAGFSASTSITRSQFGMDGYLPAVGDEVRLVIEAEAVKAE